MFGERQQKAFEDLNLTYPAVAVKFLKNRPDGYQQAEGEMPLCGYLKQCQDSGKAFYIKAENESCMGSVVTGLKPNDPAHISGDVGFLTGLFRSSAANARLYYEAPRFMYDLYHFILFCPVAVCDFDPDLIICVSETKSAHYLLRAGSYRSGDLWESKCSYVMSCSWTYVYPFISGKINHLFTGMHLGLKRLEAYPAGLHIISIPYNKIDEVVDCLYEMDKTASDPDEAPERKAVTDATFDLVFKMREDNDAPFPLKGIRHFED